MAAESTNNPPPPENSQNPGNTKLVIVAVVLAAAAVILTNIYISQIRQQNKLNSFPAYIFQVPVSSGDRIRKRDVYQISIPDTPKFRETFDQMGYVDKINLDLSISQKEPLKRSANAGEILLHRHFTSAQTDLIDQKIARGKRLKVLSVNSKTVPGALRVGMFVDMEAAFQTQYGVQVLPVMERVKIISLGTHTSYESANRRVNQSRFSSITIEVTPDQATLLNLIERTMVGDFDLSVRNPGDMELTKIPSGGLNPTVVELVERRRPATSSSSTNNRN